MGLEPDTKEYRELDAGGLYFRVKPDGQKSWQLRYKEPYGKWSWLGLGGYPQVSGAMARIKAAELRADAAEGKNPMATKQARKAAEVEAANDTFEALAREWHPSAAGARELPSASWAPWSVMSWRLPNSGKALVRMAACVRASFRSV